MSNTEHLRFPFTTPPEPGQALEVASGVYWLRMPLPFTLGHINVWAIEDSGRWVLVDTGLQTPDTVAAWTNALSGPLSGGRVGAVLCTHMHPDHIGLAGWLTREFECKLWITRLEYLTCRVLVTDTGRAAPEDGVRFYRAAGWDESAIQLYKSRFGAFGKGVYALPDSYRRLQHGDRLELGGRSWRVVVGRGHSPEHACLYCEELQVLISGDQVLPKISSNVSLFPTEPDADPLADWLESLAAIGGEVPDDMLVLPAHGLPFYGLHARLGELIGSHEASLVRLHEALATPRRAVDVFEALFTRPIKGETLFGMATGESLAHLSWLVKREFAARDCDANGVDWYRATDRKPHFGSPQRT